MLAAAAALATCVYGFWKSPTMGLVSLPVSIVVFFASVGALARPAVTAALVVVAAIATAEIGLRPTALLVIKVFLGVGLVSFVWHFWKATWRR